MDELPCLKPYFFVLILAFFVPGSLLAEITPQNVEVSTPVYTPVEGEFEPALGTYNYVVSWQGIPAATATVEVEREDDLYRISASARTHRAIDIFYRLRYRAEGKITTDKLLPRETTIEQRENSRRRDTRVQFHPDGTIESVHQSAGGNPEIHKFDPKNFTLDPFSAAFLARSQSWELGETKSFDTYNGRSRYLIELTAKDKIVMDINGQKRDVWIISPHVTKLTEKEPSDKLREASIYVTADKSREVIQITSSVFVGSVTTRMTSFEPAPEPATHLAQEKRKSQAMVIN